MIAARDAIRCARGRIGTAYADMDCMALIRDVIRRSAGGIADYRCEGTNWLWRSIGNSGKYRHLVWRQESTRGAGAGMLAFKRKGDDVHHVGLVTGEGTVIHASSTHGSVVETPLDETWDCLGEHRYIRVMRTQDEAQEQDSAKEEEEQEEMPARLIIVDSAGRHFVPIGDWRVLLGGTD